MNQSKRALPNLNMLVRQLKQDVTTLPTAMRAVFNWQRGVTELRTLRPATKLMMATMLIVTILGFILGKDYSWGIIACAAWLTTAITNRLIGDIAAQSFYLVMQFVGITVWHRKMAAQADSSELTGRKLSKLAGLSWFILAVLVYAIVLHFSKQLNGNQIYLDATLLPLGIVGSVLMVNGYRSQWVAWITLDVINVIIWFNQLRGFSPAAASMLALQLVMLANAIYGAYLWFFGQSAHRHDA
ncbi:nicotinamide riboside transporter PnuC [Lactiplantibacillus pentosus]|uniref:nicotinamide riboside transporter PnuC n=1 Tax=Lactiplantibacillus pentosus TaxID=1589 RepID=UPI0021A81B9F|nr:nicotinamide riboside transporter PnuC [Lactiplantibacillus pentosus]MCT3310638.1 ribosyl nicotinamide transporter [Lactiplantibacillus pentosus]